MAIEGKIRERGGKLYVVYATTLSTEPVRITRTWRVLESYSNKYNMHRPEDGCSAYSQGGGNWDVSAGNTAAGRVVTEPDAEVSEVPVPSPKSGGKPLRWNDGRWEKLTAKGWVSAGEGTAATAAKARAPRAAKKSKAELDREIAEALGKS